MRANADETRRVFKIAERAAWETACQQGIYADSRDDRRDGFIHLSHPTSLQGRSLSTLKTK